MRAAGAAAASVARGGDVIVLSGPLGAGKTTFAQGFGAGLHVEGQMVSPTFTIARSLAGRFADGSPANLVHVDAYRLPGSDDQPQVAASRLMDELESLGLDEELEDPGPGTVVLIEWGSAMASELASTRWEVTIDRSVADSSKDGGSVDDAPLTSDGARTVTFHAIGCADRMPALIAALQAAHGAMTER
nr:tRNA (adenosine(37)-N6)-threonylcarbamoyltransferase complex ATPase subunit type 1 TsaE [Pseudoscardovia suis]